MISWSSITFYFVLGLIVVGIPVVSDRNYLPNKKQVNSFPIEQSHIDFLGS